MKNDFISRTTGPSFSGTGRSQLLLIFLVALFTIKGAILTKLASNKLWKWLVRRDTMPTYPALSQSNLALLEVQIVSDGW